MSIENTAPAPVESQVSSETTQEGSSEASTEEAAAPAPTTAAEKRRLKLKFDNDEQEMDEEEVIKLAQKAKGSEKRFAEAAEMRKAAEASRKETLAVMEMLRSDPLSVLRDPALGVDVKALAQKVLEDEIRELELSPEEKTIRDLTKELEDIKTKQKDELTKAEKARAEKEEAEHIAKTEQELINAIESSDLPVSPYVGRRLIDVMQMAHDAGKDCTPAQAIKILEAGLRSEFESMDDTKLEKLLGAKTFGRLTKASVKKLEASKPKAPSVKTEDVGQKPAAPKVETPVQYGNISDLLGLYD